MTPIRNQLLTSLSLAPNGRILRSMLLTIACSHPGCEQQDLVSLTLDHLLDEHLVGSDGDWILYIEHHGDISVFHAAADAYRAEMAYRKTWRGRIGAWLATARHSISSRF